MVELATELCVRMVGDGAHGTRARYELSLHAARSPGLRDQLVEAGTVLRRLGAAQLAALGVPHPMAAAEEIMAVIDGLVFTALLRGPDEPDALREWFRRPLHGLLSSHLDPSHLEPAARGGEQ